jgi:ribose transport system substrate-binding protein
MNKKIIMLMSLMCIIALMLTISLASCREAAPAPVADEPAPDVDESVTIGFAMVDMTNPFFVDVMNGADQIAEAMNAEVIYRSAESSLEAQIAITETFIEQGLDAIIIDPLDPVAIQPVIERALAAGIPTLTAANLVEVPGNISTPFPAKDAFAMLMDMVAAYIDYEGDVLYMSGIPGNWILDQYLEGIVERVNAYPDINLLSEQPAQMDPALAQRIMEDWLTSYENIDAVIFTTDPDMYAAIEAINNAGRMGEFPLFSQNGDLRALEMIQNNQNEVKIDLLSGAGRIGALNMTVAIQLARGVEMPSIIWFGYIPVMTQETWDTIVANGYEMDTDYKRDAGWITPEEAIEIVNNAVAEFLDWTPPAQ